MAEKAYPFTNNGTGDGTTGGYTAAEWRKRYRYLFGDGVALEGNKLAPTGSASPLSVGTGHAVVDGLFYDNTASVSLAVTTPTVGTTGGHVILRADYSAQTVRLLAVRNTDGVSATPTLTQTSETTYEIRLATFTITTGGVITLTDARSYLHPYIRVSETNLDTSVAGNGLAGGAGTALSVNVDGTTIAITSDTLGVPNDAIDDTKVGNRVPQFYRRRGGDASDWSATGSTNYTPTAVRMQAGSQRQTFSAAANGNFTVTFPVAFSNFPLLFVTAAFDTLGTGDLIHASITPASSSTATVYWRTIDGSTVTAITVNWLAIGPE